MIRNPAAYYLRQRECQSATGAFNRTFERSLHVFPSLLDRLELQAELQGHNGCVNCLEWNEDGSLLASGSDDLKIILWDPLQHKHLWSLNSGHLGNIFSVKFLPKRIDKVITAAADHNIKLHSIKENCTLQTFRCHVNRVKRLATTASTPYLLWSASEDGTVRQFDFREHHVCQDGQPCNNVLINVGNREQRNYHSEIKCIAANSMRPELLAIGCNDQYVRLYDTRMLTKGPRPTSETVKGYVRSFTAGHLNKQTSSVRHSIMKRPITCTYVTFSADGQELLANLGGEQVYLFDTFRERTPTKFTVDDFQTSTPNTCHFISNLSSSTSTNSNMVTSFPAAKYIKRSYFTNSSATCARSESLRIRGNDAYNCKEFSLSIHYYNIAILWDANNPILYSNRAAAYLGRGWDGDAYAALRDCRMSLSLNSTHFKSWIRLSRCLNCLRLYEESKACLDFVKSCFACYADKEIVKSLESEINDGLAAIERERRHNHTTNNQSRNSMKCSDFKMRYCGHCNTTTDIKEANFFGANSQFIMAGSDEGSFFIWDRESTNLLHVIRGDDSIVNCLQPHPAQCILATSGIDHVVRLWSPLSRVKETQTRHLHGIDLLSSENQRRMNFDPFEVMLLNVIYHSEASNDGNNNPDGEDNNDNDDDNDNDNANNVDSNLNPLSCRTS